MAVEFIPSQSLSTVTTTRRAIDSLVRPVLATTTLTPSSTNPLPSRPVSTQSRVDLPNGILQSQSGRAPADVSIAQAQQLIKNSLTAAYQIQDALDTLSSYLNTRGFTSLTDSESAIAPGGTRISGVTIEAAASRVVDAIDALVSSVTLNGLNLISSGSRPIRIQTTEFGGRLTVTPQPLDSFGLNIRDLAAVDRFDSKEAKGRVDIARFSISSSIQNLEALQRSLQTGTAASRSFSAISAPGDGVSSRGALIDFQA